MIISNITHTGLGARDAVYPCSGITIWDGPYGSGKTIAQDAVRLAMTGSTRDIKTIGRLRDTIWRATSPHARAYVEIEGVEIERTWSDSQSIEINPPVPGLGKNLKLNQFWIDQNMGGPPVTADLQEIDDLSPEKFNAWILAKIGAEEIDIANAIRNSIDDETADATVIACIEKLLDSNRQGTLSASEYIQILEEKSREQKNATVALLHDAEASRRDSSRLATSIPAIAQAIADLQTQLDSAKSEHEATVKLLGKQEERNARVLASHSRIESAGIELAKYSGVPDNWDVETKRADAERLSSAAKIARDAAANVERAIQAETETQAKIETARKAIGEWLAHSLERGEMMLDEAAHDLKSATDHALELEKREMLECPKCGHEFKTASAEKELETAKFNCDAQAKRHAAHLAAVEQERQVPGDHFLNDKELLRLQGCRTQLETEEKTLASIQNRLPLAQKKSDDARDTVTVILIEMLGCEYDATCDPVESADNLAKHYLSMLTAIQSRDQARANKAAADAELAGLATVNLDDLRELETIYKAAVRDLEKQIAEKQRELASAQKMVGDEDRITALESQIETEKLVVEIVQAVRADVADGALQALASTINRVLDSIAIGTVAIQDGSFTLTTDAGTRQWAALSSGERSFVGIAIAAAFAEKRGPQRLQCISIDNAECVGQEKLGDLLKMASFIWETLEVQCLIAGHFDANQIKYKFSYLAVHDLRAVE